MVVGDKIWTREKLPTVMILERGRIQGVKSKSESRYPCVPRISLDMEVAVVVVGELCCT
jgi:hypothetical protein